MNVPFAHNPTPDFSHDLHRELHPHNPHNVLFDPKQLHVITVVSNPFRYQSRYSIYKDFEQHVLSAGAQLWVAELQLRDRPFLVTEKDNPYHIQLRSDHVLWVKENLWNIVASRLPDDALYIMVADADVHFVRPDWAVETIHMLQHYEVIQPWTESFDLGPKFETREHHTSFCFDYLKDTVHYPSKLHFDQVMEMNARTRQPRLHGEKADESRRHRHHHKHHHHHGHHHHHHHHHPEPEPPYPYYGGMGIRPYTYHPGFAWAWRRTALNKVGGFIDKAILGNADHHMALALIGEATRSLHSKTTQEYKDMVYQWEERAKALNRNIGYMEGTIMHRWHGHKRSRGYNNRWQVLINHEYNPLKDVRYEANGVLALQPDKWRLKHDIDSYFVSRNEDDISTD